MNQSKKITYGDNVQASTNGTVDIVCFGFRARDLHGTRLPFLNAQSILKGSMDSSFRFCAGGAGGASPGMSGMLLLCGLTIWEKDKVRLSFASRKTSVVKSKSKFVLPIWDKASMHAMTRDILYLFQCYHLNEVTHVSCDSLSPIIFLSRI